MTEKMEAVRKPPSHLNLHSHPSFAPSFRLKRKGPLPPHLPKTLNSTLERGTPQILGFCSTQLLPPLFCIFNPSLAIKFVPSTQKHINFFKEKLYGGQVEKMKN